MPSYTVYNPNGGTTTVNAKNLQSALGNVPGSTASPPSAPAQPSQQTSSGGGGGGGGGGGTTYNTVNGPKTPAQMAAELKTAGWGGNPSDLASVVNAYATTTGGSATPAGGGWQGGGGGSPPPATGGNSGGFMGGDFAQQWAAELAMQNAQNAATVAYNNAKLRLDTDKQAFDQAQQAFVNEITKSGLTGTYQGSPTQAALQYGANTFGTWGAPQQGQQTLAAQKQAFDQAQQAAGLTGWYTPPQYSPVPPITSPASGGAPAGAGLSYPPGTVVRTASNQFGVVGPNGTVMPGDASNPAILQAIRAGQGIATVPDSAFAAAQQTVAPPTAAPGTAPVGGQPGGQPVQTLAGNEQAYTQWLRAQQEALAQWQAQQGAAQNYLTMMAGLRGPADWMQYQKVLGATPGGMKDLAAAAAGQYIPGGGATTGVAPTPVSLGGFVNSATGGGAQQPGMDYAMGGAQPQPGMQQYDVMPNQQNQLTWIGHQGGGPSREAQAFQKSLVAPNQMAPQTWNALQPSQQQMLLGAWEAQGYSKDDATNLFKQSLPKYGGMAPTAGTFRLQ